MGGRWGLCYFNHWDFATIISEEDYYFLISKLKAEIITHMKNNNEHKTSGYP